MHQRRWRLKKAKQARRLPPAQPQPQQETSSSALPAPDGAFTEFLAGLNPDELLQGSCLTESKRAFAKSMLGIKAEADHIFEAAKAKQEQEVAAAWAEFHKANAVAELDYGHAFKALRTRRKVLFDQADKWLEAAFRELRDDERKKSTLVQARFVGHVNEGFARHRQDTARAIALQSAKLTETAEILAAYITGTPTPSFETGEPDLGAYDGDQGSDDDDESISGLDVSSDAPLPRLAIETMVPGVDPHTGDCPDTPFVNDTFAHAPRTSADSRLMSYIGSKAGSVARLGNKVTAEAGLALQRVCDEHKRRLDDIEAKLEAERARIRAVRRQALVDARGALLDAVARADAAFRKEANDSLVVLATSTDIAVLVLTGAINVKARAAVANWVDKAARDYKSFVPAPAPALGPAPAPFPGESSQGRPASAKGQGQGMTKEHDERADKRTD